MERIFNRDKIPMYLMALTQGKLPGTNLPQRQMSLPAAPRLPDAQPAEKLDPKALMNLIKLMRGEDQTRPEDHKNPPPQQPPPEAPDMPSPQGGNDLNSFVQQQLAGIANRAMGEPEAPFGQYDDLGPTGPGIQPQYPVQQQNLVDPAKMQALLQRIRGW